MNSNISWRWVDLRVKRDEMLIIKLIGPLIRTCERVEWSRPRKNVRI